MVINSIQHLAELTFDEFKELVGARYVDVWGSCAVIVTGVEMMDGKKSVRYRHYANSWSSHTETASRFLEFLSSSGYVEESFPKWGTKMKEETKVEVTVEVRDKEIAELEAKLNELKDARASAARADPTATPRPVARALGRRPRRCRLEAMPGAVSREGTRLREVLQRAVERNNRTAAAEALGKLCALEPVEPRWSHRLGETFARLRKGLEAERAFVQAAKLYAAQGFLARAIAVAKLAVEINPARADLLETLDPQRAQELHREGRPAFAPSPPPVPPPVVQAAPPPSVQRSQDATRGLDLNEICELQQLINEVCDNLDPNVLDESSPDF